MDEAALTGKNGAADVDTVADALEAYVLNDRRVLVFREQAHCLGDDGRERVRDNLALVVLDENVSNSSGAVAPFVDQRLDARRVAIEKGFDARTCDALGNGRAFVPEFGGQGPIDRPC